MVEMNLTYDLLSGIDKPRYGEWLKKLVQIALDAHGVVDFQFQNNKLGSPANRVTVNWKTLAHWGKFADSDDWILAETALQDRFGHNISLELWSSSKVLPDILQPKK